MTAELVHMVQQYLPLPLRTGERVEELHHLHHLDDSDTRLAEAIAAGQQHRPRWQRHAACRGYDVSLWFPTRGESAEQAKNICDDCIVLTDCLTWALDQPADHGIAGGLSGRQRRRLRAARTRRGGAA